MSIDNRVGNTTGPFSFVRNPQNDQSTPAINIQPTFGSGFSFGTGSAPIGQPTTIQVGSLTLPQTTIAINLSSNPETGAGQVQHGPLPFFQPTPQFLFGQPSITKPDMPKPKTQMIMDDLDDQEEDPKPLEEMKASTQPSTDSTQPQKTVPPQLQKHSQSSAVVYRHISSPLDPTCLDEDLVLSLKRSNFSYTQLSRLLEQNHHQKKMIEELLKQLQKKTQLNEIYQNFIRVKFRHIKPAIQDQNDIEIQQALEQCFFNKPLLILSFASPLIRQVMGANGVEVTMSMDLIDYNKEFEGVRQAIHSTESVIQIKQVFATKERFDHAQTENPVGLHFSGHSVPLRRQQNFHSLKEDEYCVVFEKNDGEANLIHPSMLNVCQSLKFVFFATCHSEAAGSIFHKAGVKHVICITQKSEISDEAAIFFSQNFYKLLFKGVLTICDSFSKAKKMVQTHENKAIRQEAAKFKLLVQPHDECEILGPYPKGQIEELKAPVKFPFEVAKDDDFVGRQEDMYRIAKLLLHNRLITLIGLPGIGKTAISKRIGYFLSEREIFKDGVIYISMRGKNQASGLIQSIFQYMARSKAEWGDEIAMDSQLSMIKKIEDVLSGTTTLLIIDNIEEVLQHDQTNFKTCLQNLLDRIDKLKILSTSRESIGQVGETRENVYNLKQLTNQYTFQLLEKKSGKYFDEEEKSELMKTIIPGVLAPWKAPTNFYDHPLFHIFAGHPYTVSLVAPLLEDRTNTLSVIYKKLSKMMDSENFGDQKNSTNPLHSLRNSIKASIEQVQSLQPLAIQLFCLIGLLPAGLAENDLSKLWQLRKSQSNDWVSLVETLKKYSLLVQKEETQSEITYKQQRYYLLPFMCTTAENLLSKFDLEKEQSTIVGFFMKRILKELFSGFQVEDKRGCQNLYREIIAEYETNVWSSIYRICEINRKRTERQKKDANSNHIHAHFLDGYSSTDDFERQILFKLDKTKLKSEQQTQSQSGSTKIQNKFYRSIQNYTEGSQQTFQSAQSSANESDKQEDHAIDGRKENSDKRVRFSITDNQKLSIPSILGLVANTQQDGSKNQVQVNPLQKKPKSESNYKNKNLSGRKLAEKDSNHSFSSIERPKNLSFATQSINQSNQDGSDSSFVGKDQTNEETGAAINSITQDDSDRSVVGQELQNVAPAPEQDSQTISEPQTEIGRSIAADLQGTKVNTEVTKLKSTVILGPRFKEQDSQQLQLASQERQNTPKQNQFQPSGFLSRGDVNRTFNLKTKNEPELETIIETNLKLTEYGLFLVMCTSVFILSDKRGDAQRLISLIKETKFPDQICHPNILKLEGLLLLLNKNYFEAYQKLDMAEQAFQKFSQKGNLGVAHCLAVKSYIIYTKHPEFPHDFLKKKGLNDEAKLFQKQHLNFKAAKMIYNEVGHLAGEQYCLQQLVTKQLREGKGLGEMISESKSLGIRIQQQEEQDRRDKVKTLWLKRYAGDETSLLIEIIDTKQLGKPDPIQSSTKIKYQDKRDQKMRNKSKVRFNEPNKKADDRLSSDDEVQDHKKQADKSTLLLGSVNPAAEKAQSQMDKKKSASLNQSSKSIARPQSAKALGVQQQAKDQQTHLYQKREDSFYSFDFVPYQWQILTKPAKVLPFDLNIQIEEFYLQIFKNENRRTDVFSFEFALDQASTIALQIMLDQSQPKLQKAGIKTALLCKNMLNGDQYQMKRFDKKCKKPRVKSAQKTNQKDQSQMKGELGDEDPNLLNTSQDKSSRRSSFSKKSDSSSVGRKQINIDRQETDDKMFEIKEEGLFEADDQQESIPLLMRQHSKEESGSQITSGLRVTGGFNKESFAQMLDMAQEKMYPTSRIPVTSTTQARSNSSIKNRLGADIQSKNQGLTVQSSAQQFATKIPSLFNSVAMSRVKQTNDDKNKLIQTMEESKGESDSSKQLLEAQFQQQMRKKLNNPNGNQTKAKQNQQYKVPNSTETARSRPLAFNKVAQQEKSATQQQKSGGDHVEPAQKANQK